MRADSRRILNITILIVVLILFSSMVSAIGVAPAKRIFDYTPGKQITYSLDIMNTAQEELEVLVYARGKYSERVRIDWNVLKLDPDEPQDTINVWFDIPEIDIAGPHEIDIVVVGSTPTPEGSEAVVKADIAVVSKLIIDVPYPDKYAEARVYVLDTEKGKPITVSVPVFNKGSEDINEALVELTVEDLEGNIVDYVKSEPRMIKKGKDTKFTLTSTKEFETGQYKAVARVYYDGVKRTVETMFSVGDLKIDIRSLVVNEFTLGGVANFDILLYNSWSSAINNVYAEMQITDVDNNVLTDFRTVATDVKSKGLGRLEGYWHTESVSPGIYTATITLYYANRVEQKAFSLEVQPNKIIATPLGTGRAISAEEEINFTKNGYLILLVLAMGGVIAGLVYQLKKRPAVPAQKPFVKPITPVEKIPAVPPKVSSETVEEEIPEVQGWGLVEKNLDKDEEETK